MRTRRQEKLARAVKEAVSDAISNHLSDPRIQALVSVTRVNISGDLRTADVYLSAFGEGTKGQNKTFSAIMHAQKRIQSLVADKLHCKFCPALRLHRDEVFKKTLETIKLIEQAAGELHNGNLTEQQDDNNSS